MIDNGNALHSEWVSESNLIRGWSDESVIN